MRRRTRWDNGPEETKGGRGREKGQCERVTREKDDATHARTGRRKAMDDGTRLDDEMKQRARDETAGRDDG